jgi:hypothetical protein
MSNETHETLVRLAQRIMDSEAGAATPASAPAAPPAPATPEIPSAAVPAAAVAAATPAPGELPAGIMTQAEMEAYERRPTPKSWDEQKAQMAEGERYLESFKFHQGIR